MKEESVAPGYFYLISNDSGFSTRCKEGALSMGMEKMAFYFSERQKTFVR